MCGDDGASVWNDSTRQAPGGGNEGRTTADDYHSGLRSVDRMASSLPLNGKKLALIKETVGEGVDEGVVDAIIESAKELEKLGAIVDVVSCPTFGLGLPAYYVLALSEASSNLARYDAVRYGAPNVSRSQGLGAEVKRRVLMGSYALSAGHADAYYKRAQKVQRLVSIDLNGVLERYDALLTPAAPTPAYKIDGKINDPLAMFAGDVMTVNVNLSGLPAIVVRSGFVHFEDENLKLPVGLQIIGKPFGERDLLDLAHTFEVATFETVNKDWRFQ
jgi:aspartyl-tRNA(Asn)/glutamyl-tRNA(Gln) amidotransferase subunit A